MLNVGEVSRTRYSRPKSIEYNIIIIHCHKPHRLYTPMDLYMYNVRSKYTNVPLYGWAFWIARTVENKGKR